MARAPVKPAAKTAVVKWDEEMAKMAELAAGNEAAHVGGSWISIRGGQMTYQQGEVPDNRLQGVALTSVFENAYYKGKFDPDNPATPVCFALSADGVGMAPHEASPEPQHSDCKTCPLGGDNAWGSAETGRGKACKNIRRIAIMSAEDAEDAESAKAANIAYLKTPVTSTGNWAAYVLSLRNTLKRPPLGVITEISCRPDAKTQVKVSFKFVSEIDDGAILSALRGQARAATEFLLQPYTPREEEEAPAPKARGGKRKF
jgi:hypothetical protein